MNTEKLEYHVKRRDAYQILADAEQEQIEKINPERTGPNYNPERIFWTKATGPRGPYEMYPAFQQKPTMTEDYTALLEDLKNHQGKLQHGNHFYWLFQDDITIGRKPSKR
jgi:hypothetical protein